MPVPFLAARSVLRVLIGAHRLVWPEVRAAAPKPTPTATLRLAALTLCFCLFYGALGLAAALLVGLFAVSRLMVGAAVVNATLWERRCA